MTDFSRQLSRRAFFHSGSLFLLAASTTKLVAAEDQARKVRVGLVTDLHHADKPTKGTRHYRETLTKLAEAAKQFTADRPDFVVELGDFIDAADSVETEQSYLQQVSTVFNTIPVPKHYVLGNHCVDTLTKEEFLGESAGRNRTTPSTKAASTSLFWTPAFDPTASPTAARTRPGPTPTYLLTNWSGSRPI